MKSGLSAAIVSSVLALGYVSASIAAGDHAQHGASPTPASTAANSAMTVGEVRKVDLDQAKVTLKHEPIANLEMPAMTMVFRAQSPDLLKNLVVGEKVRFHAESVNGTIVVTHIEK